MKYGAKVFYELFVKTRSGGRLGIPTVPLSEFYGAAAETFDRAGGMYRLRASVERLVQQADRSWLAECEGISYQAKNIILALPFEQTQKLIGSMQLADSKGEPVRAELTAKMSRFVHAPFISILLWFYREFTQLDHAWLLDTTIQWFFHKSRIRRWPTESGSYVELVIAGSRPSCRSHVRSSSSPRLRSWARFFPEMKNARLLKRRHPERGPRDLLGDSRSGCFPAAAGDRHRRPVPGRGLDRHRLAIDDGRRLPQWPAGRRALMGNTARFLTPETHVEGLSRLLVALGADVHCHAVRLDIVKPGYLR